MLPFGRILRAMLCIPWMGKRMQESPALDRFRRVWKRVFLLLLLLMPVWWIAGLPYDAWLFAAAGAWLLAGLAVHAWIASAIGRFLIQLRLNNHRQSKVFHRCPF